MLILLCPSRRCSSQRIYQGFVYPSVIYHIIHYDTISFLRKRRNTCLAFRVRPCFLHSQQFVNFEKKIPVLIEPPARNCNFIQVAMYFYNSVKLYFDNIQKLFLSAKLIWLFHKELRLLVIITKIILI